MARSVIIGVAVLALLLSFGWLAHQHAEARDAKPELAFTNIMATPQAGDAGIPLLLVRSQAASETPESSPTPTLASRATDASSPTPRSSCGESPIPTPTLNPSLSLPGYVSVSSDGAVFVQWTEDDSAIAGVLYRTLPEDEAPDGFKSENFAVSGIISGNFITLMIQQESGLVMAIPGLVDGETLTLFLTDEHGTSQAVSLHRGSLAEYDQAVRSLRLAASQQAACAVPTATSIAASVTDEEEAGYIDPSSKVELSISVDADGLIAGDPEAREAAIEELQEVLEPYESCAAGIVLTFGWSGELQTGLAVADAVNTILKEEFPEQFGRAAVENFANLRDPEGTVDLDIYFYPGCPAFQSR